MHRILSSLYEATLDDARWPEVSALIDAACLSKGNSLVVGKGHSQADGRILFSRFCKNGEREENAERQYFDLYYPNDERVPCLTRLHNGLLVPTRDLFTAHQLKTSPVYNEFLRESYQAGLNVRLDGPDGSSIYWILADPIRTDGWGSSQVELIEHLLPHIRQFVRVRQALAGMGLLGLSLMNLLDNARVGVIQLDINGRIRVANERALDILRKGDGLSDERSFLRARLPAENNRLKKLLAGALPALGDPPTGGSMTVGRPSGKRRLVLHVIPSAGKQSDGYERLAGPLVEIIEPENQPGIKPGLVAAVLGITSTESQVAVMLAEGRAVRDIAAALRCQENTVRYHVKQMHQKLGISRRAELVRLVMSSARGSESNS